MIGQSKQDFLTHLLQKSSILTITLTKIPCSFRNQKKIH